MRKAENELGTLVRTARKNKNLSQEALAERIGVCKRTIIDIESNTGNPKFEILTALVRELDLSLYQVFYPEIPEDLAVKNALFHELEGCSPQEMRIMLSVIKCLRDSFRGE